jgi:hypothetical protein
MPIENIMAVDSPPLPAGGSGADGKGGSGADDKDITPANADSSQRNEYRRYPAQRS